MIRSSSVPEVTAFEVGMYAFEGQDFSTVQLRYKPLPVRSIPGFPLNFERREHCVKQDNPCVRATADKARDFFKILNIVGTEKQFAYIALHE